MHYDLERLGALIATLRPAPPSWVLAAQELPAARMYLDDIVARAEADSSFRAEVLAGLEEALARAGYEPSRDLVDALRRKLGR